MNDATRKVIDTIQKLLAITVERGATAAEAATAAAKARYLLAKHELLIEQVDREAALGEIMDENLSLDKKSCGRPHWQSLLSTIAVAFDCRIVIAFGFELRGLRLTKTAQSINVVGREADARVAAMIVDRIIIEFKMQIDRAVKRLRRPRYAYEVAFILGAADAIALRLREKVFEDQTSNDRHGALVAQKGEEITQFLLARGSQPRKFRLPELVDGDGYDDGQDAGRRVNLKSNGVEGETRGVPMLAAPDK